MARSTTFTAKIGQTKLIDDKGRLDYQDKDKFVAQCVLVNLITGEHTIEVTFYKSRNYRCDIIIRDKCTGIHLIGTARDKTPSYALFAVLKKVGITFEEPMSEVCYDPYFSTPINRVANAIADTLGMLPKDRTIVLAQPESIHAR